ncbi:PilW family protein [Caenimonas terrae]|uniref:PilW family protein n=1 Tax=Caenimonas terrae TaxID=696074 RepID=A0ABW0NIT4_9BURK
MKQAARIHHGPRRERGLTLIELLVSLVIGLVLMLAVIGAYLGSVSASGSTQAQSRMNEDAQAALAVLTQHIRMASNNPKQPNYAASTPRNPVFGGTNWAVFGCDSKFTDPAAASISALSCSGAGSDALALSYEADRYNTVASGGNATDCLGQTLPVVTASVSAWSTPTVVPTTVTFTVADNRFYVDAGNLYCKGNGGATPQALVENVEDMQITYGVAPSTASTTLTVAGYMTASDIAAPADPGLAALPIADRWAKVATVRVCLIVRSEKPIAPTSESARYFQCDGSLNTAPPDLRLRRAFSTTVVLRNRIAS